MGGVIFQIIIAAYYVVMDLVLLYQYTIYNEKSESIESEVCPTDRNCTCTCSAWTPSPLPRSQVAHMRRRDTCNPHRERVQDVHSCHLVPVSWTPRPHGMRLWRGSREKAGGAFRQEFHSVALHP